jgi:membrane protease YdiL (CAAX protease family)
MIVNQPPQPNQWSLPPPGWYPDPWGWAPWRWWDGYQWTAYLYGNYGPPVPAMGPREDSPKGPGIKGGGIAAVGAGIGVAGTIAVAVAFAVGSSGHLDSHLPWYMLASQGALWTGFLGAVVFASRRNGTRSLARDYGLSWPTGPDLSTGFVGGILGRLPSTIILILIVLAGNGFNAPNGAGHHINGTRPEGTTGWVVVGLLTIVGAPIVEELFFRGLIQGAFTRRVGPTAAIFVTALIFCFAHVLNEGPAAPLVLFPAALVLGYLRHRYGRLAPGMIAHATFNAIAFVLLLVPAFR